MSKRGVITGANVDQEWMLPKWFNSYTKVSDEPILFIDFGMSTSAKTWCEKRGTLINLPSQEVAIDSALGSSIPTHILAKRHVWFQKPLALIASPFEQSIWVDLDCLFLAPLDPIFELLKQPNTLCMRQELAVRATSEQELGIVPKNAPSYNTGVLAYTKDHPLLKSLITNLRHASCHHLGDQDALSTAIYESQTRVTELEEGVHAIYPEPACQKTLIYHFASDEGKAALLEGRHFSYLAN